MVYGTYNELVTGAFKPTNITGGPHIVPYNKHLKKKHYEHIYLRSIPRSSMELLEKIYSHYQYL